MGPARRRRSARRPTARVPVIVWAVVGLHGLLLLVASVLYPTYRAPDETAHVDMVHAVAEAASYPGIGERRISQRLFESHAVVGHDRTGEREPLAARNAPPRGERPTFADLGPDVPSDVAQQMAAHPPLYYAAAATALTTVGALVPAASGWSFDQVVGFLRLFTALFVLPLPLLSYLTAERLGAPRPAALAAAVLPLGIPQLTHVGASVNNDALLVLLVAVLTLPLLAVSRGDRSVRTALVVGALGGLALLTKGFALFVPVWIAGAYGLGAVRGGGRPALRTGGAAIAVATALGGWWWIRNLLVFGTVQPAGLAGPASPEAFVPDLGWWLWFYIQRLSVRFWIEPNILPEGAPSLDLLATLVLVVCCVAALVGYRLVGQRPADLALVLAPLAGLGAIVTFGAWRVYARTGTPFAIHGRYLYGSVLGLAVVAALGGAALLRSRVRWLPLGALGVVATFQLTAGGLALAEYWGPTGVRPRVAAVLAWSPWPSSLVVVAAGGVAVLSAWLAASLVPAVKAPTTSRSAPDEDPD